MSFLEDDLRIAIDMFRIFDLPKIPTIKVENHLKEDTIIYVLGSELGVAVTEKKYRCSSEYILTMVFISNDGIYRKVNILDRFYEKTLLFEGQVEEELFHLKHYIEKIEKVERPSKEYYNLAKELLERIGKKPGICIYYSDCPWGVLAPLDEEKRRKKEIKESLEKLLKRIDEIQLEKLEKVHRYFKDLTTPALKDETKVRFYKTGDRQNENTKTK